MSGNRNVWWQVSGFWMNLNCLHSQVSVGYWSQISSRTDRALALICSVVSRLSGVQSSSYRGGSHVATLLEWGGTCLFGEPFFEGI